MPKRLAPPFRSFDLSDSEAARAKAQELADRSGREIVVTDDAGNEVCRVRPIRRNELTVVPKN